MRVAADARMLCYPHTGTGTYTRQMLRALEVSGICEIAALGTPTAWSLSAASSQSWPRIPNPAWEQGAVPEILKAVSADLYFAPTGVVPIGSVVPSVAVVHDIGFETHPEYYPAPLLQYLQRWLRSSIQSADRLIAVSQFTSEELTRIYGPQVREKTAMIPEAASEFFGVVPWGIVEKVLHACEIQKPYVLSIASQNPNKNLAGVIRSFEVVAAQSDCLLVLAGGSGSASQEIRGRIQASPNGGRIRVLGLVPDDVLHALYSGAKVFLYLSYYEGFGLPPLQAMASGIPTIVSDRAALPETVGSGAIVMDPDAHEGIAARVLALLGDEAEWLRWSLAALQRSRTLSWEDAASRIGDIFRSVLFEREERRRA